MPRGCCSSGQESRAVARIAPERGVDALARAPQGAQRLGRHALELRVLLHDQEALQDRGGIALEQIGAARIEQLADAREFFVDRPRAPEPSPGKISTPMFCSMMVLSWVTALAARKYACISCSPARRCARGRVAHVVRQALLVIEQQPVLAPSRRVVQAHAQVLQQPVMPLGLRAPRRP